MRLSADDKSPDNYVLVLTERGVEDPWSLRVWIDGVESTLVVEADDVEGWADVLETDTSGKPKVYRDSNGYRTRHTRVRGRIEFKIGEETLA